MDSTYLPTSKDLNVLALLLGKERNPETRVSTVCFHQRWAHLLLELSCTMSGLGIRGLSSFEDDGDFRINVCSRQLSRLYSLDYQCL